MIELKQAIFKSFFFVMLFALEVSAQQATWDDVRARLMDASEYSLNYDYEGPDGNYLCHYVVQGGGTKILTEVLAGSSRGSGARVLYDGLRDKDNVTVQTSILTLRRSIGSKDIKGSSLYQPLFQQLVGELVEASPRKVISKGPHKILVFGDRAKIEDYLELDAQGDPLAAWRTDKGRVTTRITFTGLSWKETAISWP